MSARRQSWKDCGSGTCRRPEHAPGGRRQTARHGSNSSVNITHHVPVHTTYFTAVVDDQGKVQTFADVYKLDPVVGAAILGKEARPEAVADNGDPKPKPQKPDGPAPSGFAPGIANP